MNFSFVLVVVAICLTDVCNGQFKILGLLDTKSELNNGKVENIRSLDEVVESLPSHSDAVELSDVTETINGPQQLDAGKENVNFIKPYEAVTNEWKQDSVQVPSDTDGALQKENITKVLETDETKSESVSGKGVTSETVSDGDIAASMFESTTSTSTTAIVTKAYRKTLQPNIRKFSYIEARSFHHPDSPNNVTPRSNNYKFVKVLKYRNKYKSKCRCERIWNCPKIQISIQRCEPDYFMCCF